MKNSIKVMKQRGKGPASPKPVAVRAAWWPPPRWAVLCLCLLLAGVGSWVFAEFVLWNTLPAELLGKWEVVEGPPEYEQATFEFFRNGTMEGRINDNGLLRLIKARIKVEEKKIYSTTEHPKTGEKLTQVQTIRVLTATELVIEDSKGKQIKMRRAM